MPSQPFTPDRRADDRALIMLVQQVHDNQQALDGKLTQHMTDETRRLAEAVADILKRSFPEGDADGHRKAHEQQMQTIAARAEFWKKLSFEVSKYGLVGLVGWLAYAAWIALLKGPK
jgi:hypothetical protein